MAVTVRPFEERDYGRMAEVGAALDPLFPFTPEVLRQRDAAPEPRVRLHRLTAEVDPAGAVGFGRLMHIWWDYHPRRYVLRITVDPAWQRRGVGSMLFDRLLQELNAWDAELVRSEARADQPMSVAFLEHRGFREWRRRWESAVEIARGRLASLEAANARTRAAGVTITTYAAERARRGERLDRDIYDLEYEIAHDQPDMDEGGQGMSFERFVSAELETPEAIPQAHFIAMLGEHLVGVSRVTRDLRHADIARQAFTGVHPEFRGRGIAQALKLRTLEFARDHGFRQIRTSNDSANDPMLHINDAIGFQRETPVIIFERRPEPS